MSRPAYLVPDPGDDKTDTTMRVEGSLFSGPSNIDLHWQEFESLGLHADCVSGELPCFNVGLRLRIEYDTMGLGEAVDMCPLYTVAIYDGLGQTVISKQLPVHSTATGNVNSQSPAVNTHNHLTPPRTEQASPWS